MDIYYLNTKGEKILLSEWPIAVTDLTQLYGRQWDVVSNEVPLKRRSKLQYITRVAKEFDVDISIYADSIGEYQNIMNDFEDVTDYDVRQETPGRLYVGDYYLECFLRDTSPSEFEEMFSTVDETLTVYSLYPHWVKEVNYSFSPPKEIDPSERPPIQGIYGDPIDPNFIHREYEFDYTRKSNYKTRYAERDYMYDYLGVTGFGGIINDMRSAADFEMTIYGYVNNPVVVIGGYAYSVNVTVYEGERLIINSKTGTVILVDSYGNVTNVYNSRNKEQSVFEKIPSGTSIVTIPDFRVDLMIYSERSEPEWSFT